MTPSPDILSDTLGWFAKSTPNPDFKNFHTQLGCHLEEVAEMLDALGAKDSMTQSILSRCKANLEKLAEHLKAEDNAVEVANREDFLDGICDQIVTGVGIAHMVRLDVVGGMREVNESNWSKFDEAGEPIRDSNQKIMKGPNYRKADLSPYV